MKRFAPISRPLWAAAFGWAACVGLPAARAAETEPGATSASEASKGWIGRVMTAPKKLAFWSKDEPAPALAETAPIAPPPPAATKGKRVAQAKKSTPAPVPAPSPTPAPAPAPPKESLWSKLNPFDGKPAAQPLLEETPPPAPASTPTGKKGRHTPIKPEPAPIQSSGQPEAAPSSAKPRFFARLWKGHEEESAPVPADPAPPLTKAEQKRLERLQAKANAALGPEKKDAKTANLVAPQKVAEAPAKKPLWNRLLHWGPESEPVPTQGATPLRVVRGAAPIPPSGKPEADKFVVNKDKTPFYLYGPNQATPPDAFLRTGMMVSLKSRNWGWAEVTLPDGRSGVMSRDALRPANAYDLSPVDPAAVASSKRKSGGSSAHYVIPPAALPELPSLLPDTPIVPGNEASAEELSNALLPPYVE